MDEEKLPLETQAAIRKYLLSAISLPVALSLIVSFVVGFLINEVARGRAYNDAYQSVQHKMNDLIAEAQAATSATQHINANANRIWADMEQSHIAIEKAKAELEALEVFQLSEDYLSLIAETISKEVAFQEVIAKSVSADIKDIKAQVDAVNTMLSRYNEGELVLGVSDLSFERWRSEQKPEKLMSESEGICFLTRVRGNFNRSSDKMEVYVEDGDWYIWGKSREGRVSGTAACLRLVAKLQ